MHAPALLQKRQKVIPGSSFFSLLPRVKKKIQLLFFEGLLFFPDFLLIIEKQKQNLLRNRVQPPFVQLMKNK